MSLTRYSRVSLTVRVGITPNCVGLWLRLGFDAMVCVYASRENNTLSIILNHISREATEAFDRYATGTLNKVGVC